MTERKPPGVNFETWVDKQINDAIARGEFDQLPGAGKPIRDLDKPYDEVWVNRLFAREGLPTEEALPTGLKLRREVERLPETVRKLHTEAAVRDAVSELNERIRAWLLVPTGPQVHLAPVNVDRVVDQWRTDRSRPAAKQPDSPGDLVPTRSGWRRWLRLGRRPR